MTVGTEKDKKTIAVNLLKKYAIILVLILMIVVMSILNPKYFQKQNAINILVQISPITIMSFGVTYVILTGGIDLGLGTYVALCSVIAAMISKAGNPAIYAIFAALFMGLLIGAVNGSIISVFKIPPFIVTLGMYQICKGVALLVTDGKPISMLGKDYQFWGQGHVLGIPMPIIILIVMFIISSILLNNMKFGKYARAIGGNEKAARISGINTPVWKFIIYAVCGLFCAIASIVQSARMDSGQPSLGIGWELDAIADSVIGGTALAGGVGTMWGALVGSMLMGVLSTGLNFLNVALYWQTVVKGVVIITAIIIDERKNHVKA